MINGKGRFQQRSVVTGTLEISGSARSPDARLLEWLDESSVVLPRLRTMVKHYDRTPGLQTLLTVLEDLGRRLEKLEGEVARLLDDRVRR